MLIFTAVTLNSSKTLSSLIITYPSQAAAVTLLALGVEAARPTRLSSGDKRALQARNAPVIPPADLIYYLDVDTGPGDHLRLFQAHYTVQELSQDGWSVASHLLRRTRSVVLFSSPMDDLDFVLGELLIHLRQWEEIAPQQTQLTICVPTEQGLQCSQEQMISSLTKRRFLKPRFFGLAIGDRSELGKSYHQTCSNFWNKAQGEFAEVRLVDCVLGSADSEELDGLTRTIRERPWTEYVDLTPRQLVEMAHAQDVEGLLAVQIDKGRRRLLLSTLANVARYGGDSSQRVCIINAWNQIDRVVGTGWLLPVLADDDVSVRQAAVNAVSSRLPRSIERLVDMALNEKLDRYDGARTVGIRSANEQILGLLIDALDNPEPSRRKMAWKILCRLGAWKRPAMVARMGKKRGRAYRGCIGAASVLARCGVGDIGAIGFLRDEFHRTKPGSKQRRIVQEAFSDLGWDIPSSPYASSPYPMSNDRSSVLTTIAVIIVVVLICYALTQINYLKLFGDILGAFLEGLNDWMING